MLTLLSTLIAQNDGGGSSLFGEIKPPQGVEQYNIAAGGVENIGIIVFASRLIQVITVVGGLFVFFNVIYAGFLYLSAMGDSGAHAKVRDQITYSVVGLLIIVASYALAGIIGLIFFGNATFILNPEICGPEGCI